MSRAKYSSGSSATDFCHDPDEEARPESVLLRFDGKDDNVSIIIARPRTFMSATHDIDMSIQSVCLSVRQ